ncbi:hypothetical protein AB0392_15070 [Nonomuraea angiospora]|uniref:hypothetical protein n=1 Tax=Nonomuraea angiospora TaxID=46172 RepID=UPI00344F9E5C
MAQALVVLPPDQARATAEACLPRRIGPRFAIDSTPYPRPDAECSHRRRHVHHDSCRCDCRSIIVLDAGYPATALTAALTETANHLVVRLPAKNVHPRDPLTWPGKVGLHRA